jgi:serine/alanine adding enzyme
LVHIMPVEVFEYSESNAIEWDSYVAGNEDCWFYNRFGWKPVIEKTYDHNSYFLANKTDGRITGILALVLVKSRLFGNSLTSLPFLDTSGLIADDSATEKTLLEKAMNLGEELKVDYLDLRQSEPLEAELVSDTRKVSLTIELKPDCEQLWKSLSSERRTRIRKAKKSGLTSEVGDIELLPTFYNIWAENMRDLGSPAHSYSFFENVLTEFKDSTGIILVRHENTCIGGAIYFAYKKRLGVPWVSSLRKYFHLYPNNILYWDAMCHAVHRGDKIFDFGRSSRDSGTYKFKILWGANPRQLYWQFKYFGRETNYIPDEGSLKYRMATWAWRRLPVGLSKIIGPKIRKNITV